MNTNNFHKTPHGKMLIICALIALLAWSSTIFSQISEGGTPPSFNHPLTLRSATSITKVPIDFYVEDLRETDQWQAREGAPLPVSKLIKVDYTMENAGYHTLLPSGENIWRLHLLAKDAVAIMLYYNDFYIPEGGRLFIYNADKSQLLGAYTHQTNPSGDVFASEFIGGDELILEYVASVTSNEKPRIAIGDIGYGYNTAALRAFCNITTRADAGPCMVNINCEEGQAWQNEKKSICYMVQRIGSKSYMCTGSLINNTAADFKPLVISAAHCAYNGAIIASAKDMEQWLFYFNREREGCSNSSIATASKSMIGCTLLVNTGLGGGSDGMLVLLKAKLPESYDVFFNGWDIRTEAASSGVGIHHPNGDYKKISTYDEPVKSYSFQSSEFTGDPQAHWNVIFKATENGHAITEGGSSGSPLFNENKLVVGTLTGGNSSCNLPRGVNLYGKLSYHWDKYKTDSTTRMDFWLDPLNTGIKTFSGLYSKTFKPSPLNLKTVNLGHSVSLMWDAPQGDEHPNAYYIYRNNIKIAETDLLTFIDYAPVMGLVTYSVSALYDGNEESGFVTSSIFLIKYKAPFDLKAELKSDNNNQVALSWKAPVYDQTIYWGTLSPTIMIGFDQKAPFYFGQKWTNNEIAPLHNNSIVAVQFFPIENNTYEIFITQGAHTYRQPIDTTSLKMRVLNTINLNTSFTINGANSLIVSIFTTQIGNYYPAICDNGPAVNGKGNMCSFNGIDWFLLNEDEEPDSYNYNFVISAIITSENGGTSTRSNEASFSDISKVIKNNAPTQLRKSTLPINAQVSIRNSAPAAFPKITNYRIYRSGSFVKDVSPSQTSGSDTYLINSVYYQVSAIYDQLESEKSDTARIIIVKNDLLANSVQISPTYFTNYITLQGYEHVSRMEVVSITGKLMLTLNRPSQQIGTSSLPPGIYFFRLYDFNNRNTIIKAVKSQ